MTAAQGRIEEIREAREVAPVRQTSQSEVGQIDERFNDGGIRNAMRFRTENVDPTFFWSYLTAALASAGGAIFCVAVFVTEGGGYRLPTAVGAILCGASSALFIRGCLVARKLR